MAGTLADNVAGMFSRERANELADMIGQTRGQAGQAVGDWWNGRGLPAPPAPNAPPDFSTLGGRLAYAFGTKGLPPMNFQPPPGALPALDDALRANGADINSPSAMPAAPAAPAAVVAAASAPAAKTVPDVSTPGVKAAAAQGIDPRYAALAEAGNHLNAGMMLQLAATMHPMAMHDQLLGSLYAPVQQQFLDAQAAIAQHPDAATRNAAQLQLAKNHQSDIENIFGAALSPYIKAQAHALSMGFPSLGNPGAVPGAPQ